MKITYTRFGDAFSDHGAEEKVRFSYDHDIDIKTSTENIVTAARVLLAEGVISPDKFQLFFEDLELSVNADGSLNDWPVGFCDWDQKWLARIFRAKKRSGQEG